MKTIYYARYFLLPSIITTILLCFSACVDIQGPQVQPISEGDILSGLSVGFEAVMMVKGDTVPLTLTATAMDGSAIEIDPTKIKWKTVDPGQVSIDTLGRLIGKTTTALPVNVTASYTHNIVTKIDTVSVYVTESRLNASSIRLVVLDSNRVGARAIFGYPRVRIDLYNDGSLIQRGSSVPVQLPLQVKARFVENGGPNGEPVYEIDNDLSYLGKFWIKSSVNLFGTKVADSVEFEGLYPAAFKIIPTGGLSCKEFCAWSRGFSEKILVQPCALIVIENFVVLGGSLDILFSDSSNLGGECKPIEEDALKEGLKRFGTTLPVGQSIIRGNILGMRPYTAGVRRTRTFGEVYIGARSTETKNVYPFEVRYQICCK